MPIPRVVIVAGDPLARAGLAALLAERSDVTAVAAVAPAERQAIATLHADVALVDAASTEPREAGDLSAQLALVALVSGEAQAAELVAAGARAAVFRDAGADRIAAALVAAAQGLLALEGALSSWIRPPGQRAGPEIEALTPREAEVLALLAEGLANKSIAQRLGISERTAKFHVESILAKLGAESRSEAIVLAARRGMIAL